MVINIFPSYFNLFFGTQQYLVNSLEILLLYILNVTFGNRPHKDRSVQSIFYKFWWNFKSQLMIFLEQRP